MSLIYTRTNSNWCDNVENVLHQKSASIFCPKMNAEIPENVLNIFMHKRRCRTGVTVPRRRVAMESVEIPRLRNLHYSIFLLLVISAPWGPLVRNISVKTGVHVIILEGDEDCWNISFIRLAANRFFYFWKSTICLSISCRPFQSTLVSDHWNSDRRLLSYLSVLRILQEWFRWTPIPPLLTA